MGFKDHDFQLLSNIAIGSVINAVMLGFRFTTNVSLLFKSSLLDKLGKRGQILQVGKTKLGRYVFIL
jgi:hypothetical protein